MTSEVLALFRHCKGTFLPRSVIENVDGASLLVVESNASNGMGTTRSSRKDSCTTSKELVGVDVTSNTNIDIR